MVLKPQDLLVILKLWVGRERTWTYQQLAEELGLSPAETHNSVKRAVRSGLLIFEDPQEVRKQFGPGKVWRAVPNASALRGFLIHGARYAFPADMGQVTWGVPTAHAAPPLKEALVASEDLPPVWPHKEGTQRGTSVSPIYPSAPEAARRDPHLYELLALLDAQRIGRARERNMSARMIEERLK